jgi:ribosome-associated toxin RatA of RatAB toxin-antitoxin module
VAQAEIHEVLSVDSAKLAAAIVNYERYPEYVDGCSGAKVIKKENGKTVVRYTVNLIKEISYTLEHTEDAASGRYSWHLLESDFLKKNSGSWQIKPAGSDKTDVHYTLEVEFKIPVPGLILNRLVKSSLPAMLRNFEKEAKRG